MKLLVIIFYNNAWLDDHPDQKANVTRVEDVQMVEAREGEVLVIKDNVDEYIKLNYISHIQIHPQRNKEG